MHQIVPSISYILIFDSDELSHERATCVTQKLNSLQEEMLKHSSEGDLQGSSFPIWTYINDDIRQFNGYEWVLQKYKFTKIIIVPKWEGFMLQT